MIPYAGAVFDVCNAGIYYYEGKYLEMGLNLASAATTAVSGMPIAKAASKALGAAGASLKTADNLGCMIATGVKAAPHAATVVLASAQATEKFKEGKYLEGMLSLITVGSSLYRMKNVGKFCFTEGTQIVVGMGLADDGTILYDTKNIEDIQVGDLVYSYDTATGEVSQKEVTSTSALRSDHINYLTIVDESGEEQVIETTDTHPFWVVTDEPDLERAAREIVDENGIVLYHENLEPSLNGFWVEAKDLCVGDVFLGANGELSMLTNAVRVEQSGGIAVFNFTVEGNHNYFILAKEYEYGQTCVLVHNGEKCFVRYTNETEALKSTEGSKLVLDKVFNGKYKNIAEVGAIKKPRELGKNITHKIIIEVREGARAWLKSKGVTDALGHEGTWHIPAKLLGEFNKLFVKSIKMIRI